jgi:hypothetical protein
LRGRLQTLADLGSGKMMRKFTSVRALGIKPRDSYVQHNFRALLSVPENVGDMRSTLADFPHALHSVVFLAASPLSYLRDSVVQL